MDIFAKVTVIGEGVRGTLAKQLIERFDLEGAIRRPTRPASRRSGASIPKKHRPGRVVHGLAFPEILKGFHGMWLYDMKDNLISYGFVTLLENENPHCDPHLEAQKFKTNPWMRWLLEGAELVRYGAKTIPTGGLYSQPKLYVDGAMLVGDSASFCNAQNLAGHPHGDEVRHARGGDAGRRAREAGLLRPRRSAATPSATGAAGPTTSTTRRGTSRRRCRRASSSSG